MELFFICCVVILMTVAMVSIIDIITLYKYWRQIRSKGGK
jgi:hypothetical protein